MPHVFLSALFFIFKNILRRIHKTSDKVKSILGELGMVEHEPHRSLLFFHPPYLSSLQLSSLQPVGAHRMPGH